MCLDAIRCCIPDCLYDCLRKNCCDCCFDKDANTDKKVQVVAKQVNHSPAVVHHQRLVSSETISIKRALQEAPNDASISAVGSLSTTLVQSAP